ncbi:MAG: hypothetical protein R3B47_18300 [Bacteroidia bacterium]
MYSAAYHSGRLSVCDLAYHMYVSGTTSFEVQVSDGGRGGPNSLQVALSQTSRLLTLHGK